MLIPRWFAYHFLAMAFLIVATTISGGIWHPDAAPWLVVAATCVIASALTRGDLSIGASHLRQYGWLSFILLNFFGLFFSPSLHWSSMGHYNQTRVAIHVCAILIALACLARPGGMLSRHGVASLFTLGLLVRVLAIMATPNPMIDVWDVHQVGAEAILQGQSPYAVAMPNANSLPYGYRLTGYPYPALPLLALVPFKALLGDTRFGIVAIELVALIALWRVIEKRGPNASFLVPLLLCFYLQPTACVIAEKAWTEPLIVASLIAIVLFRHHPAAIGFAVTTKQYMPLWAALLLTGKGKRVHGVLIALCTIVACELPFALWDWASFAWFFPRVENIDFRFENLSLNRALQYFVNWHLPIQPILAATMLCWTVTILLGVRYDFVRNKVLMWRLNLLAFFAMHMLGFAFLNHFYYLESLTLLPTVVFVLDIRPKSES